VRFEEADALTFDLTPATVVTLWTLPEMNLKLRPRLLQQLRPGARVVGHSFDMGDWLPERTEIVTYGDDDAALVFLWRPAGGGAASQHSGRAAAAARRV
jgi:hypothetical protein